MTAVRIAGFFTDVPSVTLSVAGRVVTARRGELLAAALLASGILALRESPAAGMPRGAFCFMGICQECLVRVNGELRQACLTSAEDGLEIELKGAL